MVDNMAELVYRKMGAKIRYYRQVKGINQTDFAIKVFFPISEQNRKRQADSKPACAFEYCRGLGGGGSGAVGR